MRRTRRRGTIRRATIRRGAINGRDVAAASRDSFCSLLDLRPRVLQCYGAIKDESAGSGIRIDAEVSQTLELVSTPLRSMGQGGFEFGMRNYFKRVGIQVGRELLSLFDLIRIFFSKQLVVE